MRGRAPCDWKVQPGDPYLVLIYPAQQFSLGLKPDPSRLHRLFYPQVPAVLCAKSAGKVSAMPVVSYAFVSVSPPLIVVACDPGGYTYKLASASRAFSLCLLDRQHVGAVERLASQSGREHRDKLADAGLTHVRGTALDVPVVNASAASMECSLQSKRRVGDHVLLVGRVVACRASEDFTDFWKFRKYRPILYTGWRGGMTEYGEG